MKTATQRELRNAHDKYIDDILLGDIHNEPKRFWSYLKGKRQDSQGVAPLRKTDGFLHNDAPTKAEILNQNFIQCTPKKTLPIYQTWITAHIKTCKT